MAVMSPAKVGMTKDALAELMAEHGIKNANQLALLLDINRSTVLRWLKGQRRIDIRAAALIREHLRKKKKK
jgi:predicted ArsR family transcriptional regulator